MDLQKTLEDMIKKACTVLGKNMPAIPRIELVQSRMKSSVAHARYKRTENIAVITLGADFFKLLKVQMRETLIHELSHIVQRIFWPNSEPHGPEWKHLMHLFGFPNARVCVGHSDFAESVSFTRVKRESTIVYTCFCCKSKINIGLNLQQKIKDNKGKYHCMKCKSVITIGHASYNY